MKISSNDLDDLVTEMERYLDAGFYYMSYSNSKECLKSDHVSYFDNEFDIAAHRSYFPEHGMTLINPLLEVLQVIHKNAKELNGNWSLPIDIAQINTNYQLREEYKNTIMEIENVKVEELSPLAKALLYTGMGKISNDEVNEKIAEGKATFQLGFTEEFKDGAGTAVVNVAKGEDGNYYPKNYDIVVKQEGKEDLKRNYRFHGRIAVPNGKEKPDKINPTITFKEAYNQMQGRGVHKTFVFVDIKHPENNRKYQASEYIDFTKTDKDGNYKTEKFYDLDIDKKLKSLPLVANMDADNFKELSDSLKRGNIQMTKYIAADGTQEAIYLEANARFNTINAYDKDMKPISLSEKRQQELEAIEQKKQGESQKEGEKQGQKAEKKTDAPVKKAGRSKKMT
jgi:hypothetical protein